MILKFKDSRNNWKYVTLGDFVVNKVDISKDIEHILKPYTLEEIAEYGSEVTKSILLQIGICIRDKTDMWSNQPILDWNVIHKLQTVVVVENIISSVDTYCEEYFGSNKIGQSIKYNQSIYVISDECYLMDNQGKTIEKLM